MSTTSDVKFLKTYLKELQKANQIIPEIEFDLTTEDDPFKLPSPTSPNAERAARLADKYGFDGSLFRNLTGADDSRSTLRLMGRLSKKIETIPRIIAQIEKSVSIVLKEATKLLSKGFTFGSGQAFFEGKDLKLPAGEVIDILKKLADLSGKTVKHKDLDSQSTDSNASDFLRGRIITIRATLKKNKVPYRIRSIRGTGYVLEQT